MIGVYLLRKPRPKGLMRLRKMVLNLDRAAGDTLVRRIADAIGREIREGRLKPGTELPGSRALAEDLVVNPNTVARAYGDLMREGLLESRAGRGVFTTHKRKIYSRTEGWRRLEPLLNALIGEAMVLDFTREELRGAFEEKLGKWKHPKGGDKKNE